MVRLLLDIRARPGSKPRLCTRPRSAVWWLLKRLCDIDYLLWCRRWPLTGDCLMPIARLSWIGWDTSAATWQSEQPVDIAAQLAGILLDRACWLLRRRGR